MIETKNALALLFDYDEVIYLSSPVGSDNTEAKLTTLTDFDSNIKDVHTFYSINPLSYNNANVRPDGSKGSYRASINVTQFRNFLFECDSLPLNVQLELLPLINAEVPIRLATYSGGKSYHLIVSCADTLFTSSVKDKVSMYKNVWNGLHEKLVLIVTAYLNERSLEVPAKIFDTSTKDPARLSRLPGAIRFLKQETSVKGDFAEWAVQQEVVHTGGLVASEDLLVLSSETKLHQYTNATKEIDDTVDVTSFERRLSALSSLQWLRDRLEYPERWTAREGMYVELFKYTLWAIDATQVPYSTFNLYLTKRVYPSIVAKGYTRNPAAGVIAAYSYKGLL